MSNPASPFERTAPPQLRLKKNSQRRLLAGHEWVFSNELEPEMLRTASPHKGQLVHLGDHRGKFLASAWYNPQTLIAARVLDRQPLAGFGPRELEQRLTSALALRQQMFDSPHYRWVHGEADQLPGLVVDRFGDVASVQITCAGMEGVRSELLEVLQRLGNLRSILVHDDSEFRKLEGLPVGSSERIGEPVDRLIVREGTLEFSVPAVGGQKTGWFYDQRDNRQRLARYLSGRTVADLYSYAGGWGLQAARAGAASVVCVDSSPTAIAMVEENAQRNQLSVQTMCADSLATLKAWHEAGQRWDVVVIDPPALIKRRKDTEAGIQAYYQLNRLAVRTVAPGGLLVSCSCSHHLPEEELVGIVHHAAAKEAGRPVAILEFGGQSADHPVHPAMPETRYLKALVARIG